MEALNILNVNTPFLLAHVQKDLNIPEQPNQESNDEEKKEQLELKEAQEADKKKAKKSSYCPLKEAKRREQEERRKAKLHQAFLEAPERERLTIEIIHHKRRLSSKIFSGLERAKEKILAREINVFTSPLSELQSFCQALTSFGA
ncbi:MAG: hypothetical protein AB8G05_01275 [Oligoflexales bacterium]